MLLLLPLAASDRNHAPSHAKLLKAFGPYPEDRALILPTPDAFHDPLFKRVIEELVSCFSPDNVRVEVTPNSFEGGWPYGPNCHFKFAMETASNMGWDKQEMMWMEPDLCPTRHGWHQKAKDDYKMGSTPFRGMICDTRLEVTDPATKVVSPKYTGTTHLVGAGLYPAEYIKYICPVNRSPMASFRTPSYVMPFDVKCEAQHLPATQSPIWLHRMRTINWRRVDGTVFTCEDQKKDQFGLTYAGPVDLANICLVHGPKDESFAEAILNGPPLGPVHVAPQAPVVQASAETPNAADSVAEAFDAIAAEKRRSEVLLDEIDGLKGDIELQLQDNKELREENVSLKAEVQSLSQLKADRESQLDDRDSQLQQQEVKIMQLESQLRDFSEDRKGSPSEEAESKPPVTAPAPKSVKPPAKKIAKKPVAAGV